MWKVILAHINKQGECLGMLTREVDESKPISEWSNVAQLNMWRALWKKS